MAGVLGHCTIAVAAANADSTVLPGSPAGACAALAVPRILHKASRSHHHCTYIQQFAVRASHPSGPVSAAVLHLLVQSGALHNFVGSLFFLDGWRVAAVNSLVGLAVFRSSVRPSCSQLLAGPFAESAAWRRLAAAMDKVAAGVFRRKLQKPELALAVCSTTVSSMQVLLSCASVYATFLIERGYRLHFKQQHLPASVAAMQGHVYAPPWWLELPQVLLQLWVPLVLTWLAAGAWYGLATAV